MSKGVGIFFLNLSIRLCKHFFKRNQKVYKTSYKLFNTCVKRNLLCLGSYNHYKQFKKENMQDKKIYFHSSTIAKKCPISFHAYMKASSFLNETRFTFIQSCLKKNKILCTRCKGKYPFSLINVNKFYLFLIQVFKTMLMRYY